MSISISNYDPTEGQAWDDFVARFDEATLYHTTAWSRFLTQTFGHRPRLLAARSGGQIVGVLPLVQVQAPLLGKKLISVPYQASAGLPLCEDDAVALALVEHALDIGRREGVKYIEIRGEAGSQVLSKAGFVERHAETVDSTVPIQTVTRSTIVRGHRQDINRVARLGIRIDEATTLKEWRVFYDMFEEAQRMFAAIGLGWPFFLNLYRSMPTKAKVRLARLDGQVIGGAFLLCHHKTIFSKQAVVLPEHTRTGLGKGLVWSTLEWGKKEGYEHLNLGISLRSQDYVRAFKEGFCGVSRPLSSYVVAIGAEPPSFEDLYEGYGTAKKIWMKMPLPATKAAGALMTRWFC